jgi:uncharacterized protein YgbK (DUF1537 family)
MTVLGCIADDFTGGTDVAAALRRAGLSVALLFGVPSTGDDIPAADAVVVALKTRTVPVDDAVAQSVAALAWLRRAGAERIYFKYCSTFDSTAEGNIGPVADALLEALDEQQTLVCPASPEHGRTTYLGHHFVHGDLLEASSMRHHPLTPMTDSRLDRWLRLQTDGAVDLLTLPVVRAGRHAVADRLAALRSVGVRHVVVDATSDADLAIVAEAATRLALVTGGAGLAAELGRVLAGTPGRHGHVAQPELPAGPAVVLAGSCSAATLEQVEKAAASMPAYRLDPVATPDPRVMTAAAVAWVEEHAGDGPVIVYSSAGPDDRAAARAAMGPAVAEHLERALGDVARAAVATGVRRVVVAGGETSGAVVQALGTTSVVVQGEADRGVPWCVTVGPDPLALLLKSGNFGASDLLVRASGGSTA